MRRYAPGGASYSIGPGPMGPAVRTILFANIGMYVLTLFAARTVVFWLGLTPEAVLERGRVWQLATYLFVHSTDPMHILINMLMLWMFGVELERRWGTRAFTTYYAITGIGAGVGVVLAALLPFASAQEAYTIPTVGASGAIFGLMLAWALVFPDRQILFMMIFPLPARVFVAIMGALQFLYAFRAVGNGVSNVAHLSGLLIGYLYLRGPRNLRLEFQYRLTKWRMERMRRRFGIHQGGKNRWGDRVH